MQVFEHCPSDRAPVRRACTPSNLVEDLKALIGHVVEDVCQFEHLDKECALAAREVIECPDPCKNPVEDAYLYKTGRDKTSCLGHDAAERYGTHVGGLSCHVRSGNDHDLGL